MASSVGVSTMLFGALGPISAVVVRLRHFFTVFRFRPSRGKGPVLSCDAWNPDHSLVRPLPGRRTHAIANPPPDVS